MITKTKTYTAHLSQGITCTVEYALNTGTFKTLFEWANGEIITDITELDISLNDIELINKLLIEVKNDN